MKSRGNSICSCKKGICWKLRNSLKELMHKVLLAGTHLGSSRQLVAWRELKSYRERLGCMALGK